MPGFIDKAGDLVRGAIRAYHGSPHNFNKFDSRKIGTGEGAQAFGYGMYFAGDENVARHYRDGLRTLGTPEERASIRLLESRLDEIAETQGVPVAGWGGLMDPPDTPEVRNIRRQLEDLQAAIESRPGHMYEVNIGVPERELLDWDAPISKQPESVQRLYGEYRLNEPGDGGRIYRDASVRLGSGYDDDLLGMLGDRDASQELLQAGVPGIRYLDANSRAGRSSARNYVMFPGTEDSIRILRKYGLLPATLAAKGVLNPQQEAGSKAPAF